MIERNIEYEQMFNVEGVHWWYKNLHELVLHNIILLFPSRLDMIIVDAGCGTGGLLHFLKQKGYSRCEGFDISVSAVKLSSLRDIGVYNGNMKKIKQYYKPSSLDIVVSNDNLYFLEEAEVKKYFEDIHLILKPGGVFMLNCPTIEAFSGIHDNAVGINKRISIQDIRYFASLSDFTIVSTLYWPFLLSPVIWVFRLIQRLRFKFNPTISIISDATLLSPTVNTILGKIVSMENKIFRHKPWGSSLFVVLKKK